MSQGPFDSDTFEPLEDGGLGPLDDLGPLDTHEGDYGGRVEAPRLVEGTTPSPAAASQETGPTAAQAFTPDPVGTIGADIQWSGSSPLSVTVDRDWRDRGTPVDLLRAVREAVNKHLGVQESWLTGVRLRDVPLHRLAEFNALLDEALAEEDRDPGAREVADRGHLRSTWQDGSVLSIEGDAEWIIRTPHERLETELVDICVRPPSKERHTTIARKRLTAFLGGSHE